MRDNAGGCIPLRKLSLTAPPYVYFTNSLRIVHAHFTHSQHTGNMATHCHAQLTHSLGIVYAHVMRSHHQITFLPRIVAHSLGIVAHSLGIVCAHVMRSHYQGTFFPFVLFPHCPFPLCPFFCHFPFCPLPQLVSPFVFSPFFIFRFVPFSTLSCFLLVFLFPFFEIPFSPKSGECWVLNLDKC